MAYPIHPSKGNLDLMYSVLYDDYDAENAIAIIRELDKETPFPDAPPSRFKVTVTYKATNGGTLSGNLSERVWAGESPTNVPTPVDAKYIQFFRWEDANGMVVDPATVVVEEDTTFTAVFRVIDPEKFTVTYKVDQDGTFNGTGATTVYEQVIDGEYPVNVPATVPDTGCEFVTWVDESNNPIDPTKVAITEDRIFTAIFELMIVSITWYEARPTTADTETKNVWEHTLEYKANEMVAESWHHTTSGPIFDAEGSYMSPFSAIALQNTYYMRIENTQTLTPSIWTRYRKTFFAGPGGHINNTDGEVRYTISQEGSGTAGSIVVPTPVPEEGWEFVKWVNYDTGATVANPKTDNNTYGASTKYIAIFKKV